MMFQTDVDSEMFAVLRQLLPETYFDSAFALESTIAYVFSYCCCAQFNSFYKKWPNFAIDEESKRTKEMCFTGLSNYMNKHLQFFSLVLQLFISIYRFVVDKKVLFAIAHLTTCVSHLPWMMKKTRSK